MVEERDHIAVAPPSPRELDASIPDVVAAITLKLMAKRAEAEATPPAAPPPPPASEVLLTEIRDLLRERR